MNERIRELWSKAGGHYDTGNQHTWPQYTIDDPEKFARLIVLECTKVIVFGGYRNPALGGKYPLTPPEIATMIKEHFGVEE
jgi:hypothetical protein